MLRFKKILSLLFCLISKITIAQNVQNFDIASIKTDKTYLNFVQYKDELYIGTSEGAIKISVTNNKETVLSQHKGYLAIENANVVGNRLSYEFRPSDNSYNYLLPEKYKTTQSRYTIFNKKLYIINNGLLFVFKQNNYSVSYDSLSIRSITKNYIGTYNGIYKNGVKIKYPQFTDGNIREFGNEAVICYGGVYRDSSGTVTIYNNATNGEFQIGKQEIGSARDILQLNDGNYAVATNTGIYVVNFAKKTARAIYSNPKKNEYYTVFQLQTNQIDLNRFYYTVNDKVYYYVVSTQTPVLVIDTKQNRDIRDVYASNLSNLYILFENKLSKYVRNNRTFLYDETVFTEDINFAHNIAFLNEMICITTNVGTHLYELQTNKLYKNIIPDEANKRSLFVINDTIKYGTPHGLITFSNQDIKNIITEYEANNKNNYSLTEDYKNYIIYFLIIVIIVITIIGLKINDKKNKEITTVIPDNSITKENIVKYIHENIKLVTIQSICAKFGLTPVRLYELLENDKPGEIIRAHRLNLVRRYRKEKKDDAFIAENTGFSVSYLKKIY